MKKISALMLVLLAAAGVFAQPVQKEKEKTAIADAKSAEAKTAAPLTLAKAALNAHGGDKFKNMKTLVVRGSANVSGSPTQSVPASFAMILAGEKYRFDVTAPPFLNFSQIYDGEQTLTSMPGLTLPPLNRLGLPLLAKIEEKGFTVSELPEKLRKKRGFRITSPEGYYTDFITDEKSNLVKEYESSYDFNGRQVTTAVAIDKYRDVSGALINEKFAQRLEMGQFTAYADFKARDILVDSELESTAFSMAKGK
jgi:hypothetical protein